MRLPRIWGTHSHYFTNMVGPGDDPAVPSETGVKNIIKNFINNQGGNLVQGDVVKYDETGDNFVKKPNSNNDLDIMGVVIGPLTYANAASVPVLLQGYHPGVKVTGAVSRGDYLFGSTTSGVAKADNAATAGAFARVVQDDASGLAPALIFDMVLGTGTGGGATQIVETGGPTTLDVAAIPDQRVFFRNGTNIVGRKLLGMGLQYHPDLPPNSPDSRNDEFDDNSLAGAWTQVNGGGATHGVSETARTGFVQLSNLDGGGGSDTGIYKAFVPGANAFTVVAKIHGHVKNAGSNQNNLQFFDGSGNFIYGVGKLQNFQFIVNDSGGFRTYNSIGYLQGDVGMPTYLMLQYDGGTGYAAFVSGDGMTWHRLEGASRTGTLGRAKLITVSFSSSYSELWADYIRFIAGNTFVIGGTP